MNNHPYKIQKTFYLKIYHHSIKDGLFGICAMNQQLNTISSHSWINKVKMVMNLIWHIN